MKPSNSEIKATKLMNLPMYLLLENPNGINRKKKLVLLF